MPESAVGLPAPAAGRDPIADELAAAFGVGPQECLRVAGRMLEQADADQDDHARMVARCYLARAHLAAGDVNAALEECDQTERLADDLDLPVWRARSLETRALVHHVAGDDEEAMELLTTAVALCRRAEDPVATAEALTALGQTCTTLPAFVPRAATALADARRTWRAAHDADGAASTQVQIALNLLAGARIIAVDNERGAMAAARQAVQAARLAVDEADATGAGSLAVEARLALAQAALVAGDRACADRALTSAAALLRGFPSPTQQLALHRWRAEWQRAEGWYTAAVEEARRGLALPAAAHALRDREALLGVLVAGLEAIEDVAGALAALHELHTLVATRVAELASRRAELVSVRVEAADAERRAETERRRAALLERRNAQLSFEASHDRLTGLANRRALDAELVWRIGGGRPFGLCILDLDRFKRINDLCSHQTGDRVLSRIGRLVAGSVRSVDLAARYGGEEFVLLVGHDDVATALAVAERLRAAVEAVRWPIVVPEGRVTVSVGVAMWDGHATAEELLAAADAALYEAKRGGRNRVVVAG